MTFQNLTFSFFKKRVDTLESIRQGFNNFFFTLNTFLIIYLRVWSTWICLIKRFSHISCSLIQGSRIHWGGVQPPSTSSDPWRWYHPSIWQAGIGGLRLVRGKFCSSWLWIGKIPALGVHGWIFKDPIMSLWRNLPWFVEENLLFCMMAWHVNRK